MATHYVPADRLGEVESAIHDLGASASCDDTLASTLQRFEVHAYFLQVSHARVLQVSYPRHIVLRISCHATPADAVALMCVEL